MVFWQHYAGKDIVYFCIKTAFSRTGDCLVVPRDRVVGLLFLFVVSYSCCGIGIKWKTTNRNQLFTFVTFHIHNNVCLVLLCSLYWIYICSWTVEPAKMGKIVLKQNFRLFGSGISSTRQAPAVKSYNVRKLYSQHWWSVFQKLIYSESAIYDVLQEFFFHNNALVRVAALEVRQAFAIYTVAF